MISFKEYLKEAKNQIEKDYKEGDHVWAKHPFEKAKTVAGQVHRIGRTMTVLKHKDGSLASYPHKEVSSDFEKLNPNPYKRVDEEFEASILTEAKGSGYDDEHAFVNVWNHAVHNPETLKSPESLSAEIEKARKDKNHRLNFNNQQDGFTGGKQPHHEEAYYNELHHAVNTIHNLSKHPEFADAVKNKHEASVAGASRGSVSSTWLKHGAKNATSKADITIGKHTISLKKGDAQLMSAGGEETRAVYDHSMRGMIEHGHATEKDHKEVMTGMMQVHKHLEAMKTAKSDDEKRQHRDAGQKIINDIHKKHPKLSRYVNYEATTGHGKFGTHQAGTARFIVTSGKAGATHIHDTSKEDIGHEDTLPIPRVALPKGDGRSGNVKLDYRVK